jgi:energy-converting hydrogenase Eha subunit H
MIKVDKILKIVYLNDENKRKMMALLQTIGAVKSIVTKDVSEPFAPT